MNWRKDYRSGMDICEIIILCIFFLIRFFIESQNLMTIIAFAGFGFATYDIYAEVRKEFNPYSHRFLIVRGFFLVLASLYSAFAAFFTVCFACNIKISSIVSDELSIFALLLSLPKNLYCYLLGRYLKGEGDDFL